MNDTGTTEAPIPRHSSSCSQFEPIVSPGFDSVRCLTCDATHVYDPVARPPEALTPPEPCDATPDPRNATSFDQKTIDNATRSRSVLPPPNEPLRALFDFTKLCAQWRRLEWPIWPSECDSHCTGCDILLRAVQQLRGRRDQSGEVLLTLRSFKGASFLSISEYSPRWSAVLCAVNG